MSSLHLIQSSAHKRLRDAGDHHDGSGLVSSSAESAAAADDIFGMVPYDVLAIGNHEMYYWSTVKELYDHRERWWVWKRSVARSG